MPLLALFLSEQDQLTIFPVQNRPANQYHL